MTSAERFAYDYRSAALARMQEDDVPLSKALLIETAKTAIGTPYVRGGVSTDGFDCSGFVQWAYKHVGVNLPRTAREQSTVGTPVRNFEDMVAGDIVAFKHPRRGYHTGIYVGDGKFIHSPRKRTRVRINSLSDPYFNSTFLGARRVAVDDNDLEAAQTLLAAYESQKGSLTKTDAQASRKFKAERSTSQKKASKASRSSKASKSKKSAAQASKSKKSTTATRSSKAKSSKVKSEKTKSKTVASASSRKTSSAKASAKTTSRKKSSKK